MGKRALANLGSYEHVLCEGAAASEPVHINLSFKPSGICSLKGILSHNVFLLLLQPIFVSIS